MKNFQSDAGVIDESTTIINGLQVPSLGGDKYPIFEDGFFNFKVALKKLGVEEDIQEQGMNWSEEFTHDEQFDQIFETNDEGDSLSLFKMVNYLVDAETDVLLVKIEGSFN